MRISLGRGTGKIVTRITLYDVLSIHSISDWETPKELLDYIQSLFGPSVKFD